jgi:hypothetical protein
MPRVTEAEDVEYWQWLGDRVFWTAAVPAFAFVFVLAFDLWLVLEFVYFLLWMLLAGRILNGKW